MSKLKLSKDDFTPRKLVVVVGMFFFVFVLLGCGSNSMGQFTVPLAEEFGVGKSVVMIYETFAKVAGALAAAAFGAIYRKGGPRTVMLLAGGTVIIRYALLAIATNVYYVWIGGFIAGFGISYGGSIMIMACIKPWFPKVYGTFAAICGAASSLGGSAFTLFLSNIIQTQGFRMASWVAAGAVAVGVVIAALLVKTSPDDPLRGSAVRAAQQSKKEDAKNVVLLDESGHPAMGYKEFIKQPTTWLCMILMFVIAGTNHPYVNMFNPMAEWRGYADAASVGAAAVALYYAFQVWAKFGIGMIRDKWGIKIVLVLTWGTHIISVILNMFDFGPTAFTWICALNSISGTLGQLVGAFTIITAFGKYYNPTVLGMCWTTFNIGRAIGTPLVHVPYDIWGTYTPTLIALAILAALMFFVSNYVVKSGQKMCDKLDAKWAAIDAEKAKNQSANTKAEV